MKKLAILVSFLLLPGCAQIAEHAVDAAIKHCLTFSGFSKARNKCKQGAEQSIRKWDQKN